MLGGSPTVVNISWDASTIVLVTAGDGGECGGRLDAILGPGVWLSTDPRRLGGFSGSLLLVVSVTSAMAKTINSLSGFVSHEKILSIERSRASHDIARICTGLVVLLMAPVPFRQHG